MASAVIRARKAGLLVHAEYTACWAFLLIVTAWAIASGWAAAAGFYFTPWALSALPLLVGFSIPVLLAVASLLVVPQLRSAASKVVESLPVRWLVSVHALRITALGTIAKYLNGELPGHFILPVGFPDFAIGLTALPLALWASPRSAAGRRLLIGWSVFGAAIFVYAGFALHFSVPTPIQVFFSGPTTEEIFLFPLALVPTFLVPFFIGLHLAVLWKLAGRAA